MESAVWQKCLDHLQGELTDQQFSTWIRPLQASDDGGTLRLLAPNVYVRDQVRGLFLDRITELVHHLGPHNGSATVELGVGSSEARTTLVRRTEPAPASAPAAPADSYRAGHNQLNPGFTFTAFVEEFEEKTGAYPIYPVFHMSQALAALKAGYEKAIEANGGDWPSKEQVAEGMEGLSFSGLGREVTIREDHQGLEDQLLGTTTRSDEYDFAVLENIMIFDAEDITTPVGEESVSWLETLSPGFVDEVSVDTFDGAR